MRRRTLGFALGIVTSLACTKTVTLSPSEYEEHGSGLQYRIHMRSGCSYLVASFTANDSSLVVKHFHHMDESRNDLCAPVPSTPFEIKRQDISSIERVEPGIGTPIAILTFAAIVTALVVFARGLPGGY